MDANLKYIEIHLTHPLGYMYPHLRTAAFKDSEHTRKREPYRALGGGLCNGSLLGRRTRIWGLPCPCGPFGRRWWCRWTRSHWPRCDPTRCPSRECPLPSRPYPPRLHTHTHTHTHIQTQTNMQETIKRHCEWEEWEEIKRQLNKKMHLIKERKSR